MPRRQRTDPMDIRSAEGLPELTAQQQKFVEGLIAGQTATAAYKAAYSTENATEKSVWRDASVLKKNPKVVQWLIEARKQGLLKVAYTYDDHVAELDEIKEIGIATGNVGAALGAVQSKGKAAGYYIEQHRDVTPQTDAVQTLKDIALTSPELAKQLAEQHGITEYQDGEQATKH